MRPRLGIGVVGACLLGLCGSVWAQSQWQGTTYPLATSRAPASHFLIIDTGGSGGGFGQGDVRQKLHDVSFWNARLGWTGGYGGLFRTEDGGLTWQRMKPAGGWYHLAMTGPQEVWLVEGWHPGGYGRAFLWHTTDNGATWQEVEQGKIAGYADFFARANLRWVLTGDHPSLCSEDGGVTWREERFGGLLHGNSRIAIPGDVPTDGGFTVYVAGHYQHKFRLVKSTDGGQKWSLLPVPEGAIGVGGALFFVTTQRGWVGGYAGEVAFTDDGGETWESRNLPTDQRVMSLWFDQSGHGFAAVVNTNIFRFRDTLYETHDAGRTWTPVMGGARFVEAIFALGPGQVWCVGDVPGFIQNDLVAILTRETTE